MSERLQKYLSAKKAGGVRWLVRYEREVIGGQPSPADYLSGWYEGMLDELIDIVGQGRCERLVSASNEVDACERTLWQILRDAEEESK